MKTVRRIIGISAFWLSWPLLFIYLRRGKRTRVLVVCKDKVLVVRSWHGSGKWSLPGGGLHKGEDPKSGAVRELQEETSVQLSESLLSLLIEGRQNTRGLSYDYVCFSAEVPNELPLKPQLLEVIEAKWLPISGLNIRNTGQDTLQYLAAWQQLG